MWAVIFLALDDDLYVGADEFNRSSYALPDEESARKFLQSRWEDVMNSNHAYFANNCDREKTWHEEDFARITLLDGNVYIWFTAPLNNAEKI